MGVAFWWGEPRDTRWLGETRGRGGGDIILGDDAAGHEGESDSLGRRPAGEMGGESERASMSCSPYSTARALASATTFTSPSMPKMEWMWCSSNEEASAAESARFCKWRTRLRDILLFGPARCSSYDAFR